MPATSRKELCDRLADALAAVADLSALTRECAELMPPCVRELILLRRERTLATLPAPEPPLRLRA